MNIQEQPIIRQYAETPGLRFCKIGRGFKRPFEKDWVRKPYTWEQIQAHIRKERNFGVLCGYGDLIVIDCDDADLYEAVVKTLPPSFQVLTGSGGWHCYYRCPDMTKKIVLQKNKRHFGEVQWRGAQVVAAGSLHPSGHMYSVCQDRDIATISLEQLMECIRPFVNEFRTQECPPHPKYTRSRDAMDGLSILSVINTASFREAVNGELYGPNPWHGSETGMNLWINPSKNVAYCFRCQAGISVAKAIALNEGLIGSCEDPLRGGKFLRVRRIAEKKYGVVHRMRSQSHELLHL